MELLSTTRKTHFGTRNAESLGVNLGVSCLPYRNTRSDKANFSCPLCLYATTKQTEGYLLDYDYVTN